MSKSACNREKADNANDDLYREGYSIGEQHCMLYTICTVYEFSTWTYIFKNLVSCEEENPLFRRSFGSETGGNNFHLLIVFNFNASM